MANKKIVITREPYEWEGKSYNAHIVKGVIDGKEMQVKVVPPDNGGYKVLDLIFAEGREVELLVKPYEMKSGGKTVKGNTYAARSYGANGEALETKVKPFSDSDKSLLEMIVRQK